MGALRAMSERPGVMSFSPAVHRAFKPSRADPMAQDKDGSHHAQVARKAAAGEKENAAGNAHTDVSLIRAHKNAEAVLLSMKRDVDSARSFVRS